MTTTSGYRAGAQAAKVLGLALPAEDAAFVRTVDRLRRGGDVSVGLVQYMMRERVQVICVESRDLQGDLDRSVRSLSRHGFLVLVELDGEVPEYVLVCSAEADSMLVFDARGGGAASMHAVTSSRQLGLTRRIWGLRARACD